MNREKLTNYLAKVNKIMTSINAILGVFIACLYGTVSILLFEGFEAFALIGIALIALFTCITAYK